MPNKSPTSRWLVTTAWLAERLGAPSTVVVDGSFYLPAMKRDAAAEYLAGHIPGAVRFDIDAISDHSNPLPHMLPDHKQFASEVGALGIADSDTIVVYDGAGMFSAPRVWWTFRLFGAENVFILDGGFPKWKAEQRPIEVGAAMRPPCKFEARKPADIVASLDAVRSALESKSAQVVDARPADRFVGTAPEPRPGVRSGPIPGAPDGPPTPPPRRALRPYAGRAERPLHRRGRERLARPSGEAASGICRRRRRPRPARDHELRLGSVRRHALARARCARQGPQVALR